MAPPRRPRSGCRGIHVPGHTACLAHLADADRDAYLAGLTPGTDIDHCGTPFTEPLLDDLLNALRDPATGHPRLGEARFSGAQFSGEARFEHVRFSVAAVFGDAKFSNAWSLYGEHGDARSEQVQFSGNAWFSGAQFSGDAIFGGAQFSTRAMFRTAGFASGWFGPVVCAGEVDVSLARFETPVTMEICGAGGVLLSDSVAIGGDVTPALRHSEPRSRRPGLPPGGHCLPGPLQSWWRNGGG
ncbi:pentapeptide repeat-containing protein [Streptomyces syringium]|uniref:pentapeptide repeat-containing protein n=1 Tax=Streptomyces syringium TaxID=76729 RepID=UPI0034376395